MGLLVKSAILTLLCTLFLGNAIARPKVYKAEASVKIESASGLSYKTALQNCQLKATRKLVESLMVPSLPIEWESHSFANEVEGCLSKVPRSQRVRLNGLQVQTRQEGTMIRCEASVPQGAVSELDRPYLISEIWLEHPRFLQACLTLPVYYDILWEFDDSLFLSISDKGGVEKSGILGAIVSNRLLPSIPASWWIREESPQGQNVPVANLQELVTMFQHSFRAWTGLEERILRRWDDYGLHRFSKVVRERSEQYDPKLPGPQQLSVLKPNPLNRHQGGRYPLPNRASEYLSVLLQPLEETGRALPLDSLEPGISYQVGIEEFSQSAPDFVFVLQQMVQSLREQPSADAFNLAGRALELNPANPSLRLAALCYFQAYSMDPAHPYARANFSAIQNRINSQSAEVEVQTQ